MADHAGVVTARMCDGDMPHFRATGAQHVRSAARRDPAGETFGVGGIGTRHPDGRGHRRLAAGRAMAASDTLRAASAPVGPLAAGLLLTHTSPRIAVVALAAPVVVAAALGTISPALRDLPSLSASPAGAD